MPKIKGGYYIKAKCIQDSEIAHAPPHVRETWDWLLRNVNYEDSKICKRGETFTSYAKIIDGLSWFVGWRKLTYTKGEMETALKWLTKHTMITTRKTTRGLFICVLNYDKYQNPENYEKDNGDHTEIGHVTYNEIRDVNHTILKEERTKNEEGRNNNKGEREKVKKPEASLDWLRAIPQDQLSSLAEEYSVEEHYIRLRAKDVINYCEAKGRKYANYKAALRNFIKSDLEKHPEAIKKRLSPEEEREKAEMARERTPEEQAAMEAKLNAMKASLKDKFSMVK